jgi:hypothetical protein
MENLTEAIDYLTIDSPYEQIDALKVAFAAQLMQIEEILEAYSDRSLSIEDSDLALVEAIEKNAQLQLDIFELELEIEIDEDDDESPAFSRGPFSRSFAGSPASCGAKSNGQFASFSQECGTILATLIEEYYEDPDEGIEDCAVAGGIDPDDVVGLIEGSVAIDIDTAERIGSLFPSLVENPEAMDGWISCCLDAYDEAVEGGDDGDQIASNKTQMSLMSARTRNLEAKFNQIEEGIESASRLKELMLIADKLIDEDRLTPAQKRNLFGEFEDKDDRFAVFAAACENTGVSCDKALDRIEANLHFAATSEPTAMFGQFAHSWESSSPKNEVDEAFAKNMFFK